MGRCGSLHACEQEGIVPDLITIAKGLGGGFQPIGAVLAQQRIVRCDERRQRFFQHGHTTRPPVACAAALAVQRVIERDGLLSQVRPAARPWSRCCASDSATIRTSATSWTGPVLRRRARRRPHTKVPFDPAQQLHAASSAKAWRGAS